MPRYEVSVRGVSPEYREMIIDADSRWDAVIRAGVLIGKAMGRSKRGMRPEAVRVTSVRLTDKPLKNQHQENYQVS